MSDRGLSQAALAGQLGVTPPAVSQKLSGARPITAGELEVIAAFLNVEPGELFRPVPSTDGARETASL